MSLKEISSELNTNISRGLDENEAEKRLKKYGLNEIKEHEESFIHRVSKRFFGPIPFIIEFAGILSAILGKWDDFFIILFLLIVNASIDLWQESKALNALKVLKNKLAKKSLVLRNGKFKEINAKNLVIGDIIKLKIGNIVPADVKLIKLEELEIDQSALTGESLPVFKKEGDIVYGNSIVKKGDAIAIVTGTSLNTYFGKTVSLVAKAEKINQSHLQKAVIRIGKYLIFLAIFLVTLIFIVSLFRQQPLLEILRYVLVLTIASIPVAMPAILSVTLAVGAIKISKKHAIISKLESIEELAGIDTLCFDKTGTLTQNKMSISTPISFGKFKIKDLMIYAALASSEEEKDPIETPIFEYLKEKGFYKNLRDYKKIKFKPFNPVDKRTEAVFQKNSEKLTLTKGAIQVILKLSKITIFEKKKIEDKIKEFSNEGMRTLGVAIKMGKDYEFVGIIPMFDPPREDSKEVLKEARELGLNLKMLTGDNILIAKYISNIVGIGKKILDARILNKNQKFSTVNEKTQNLKVNPEIVKEIEDANGFAQVYPEDKYFIVDTLQKQNHIVGMTGDGVNDAPALSKADGGIAVSGATDAARASADLILMDKGLSVIIDAIKESRKIFLRMKSYSIYRIAETIRLILFITASILFLGFYPISPIMIILLLIFNDLPILAIAYDRTRIEGKPVRWNLKEVLTISTGLGIFGVIASFGALYFARNIFGLSFAMIQTVIFLKLAVAGHSTIYVARTNKRFWQKPYPAPVLLIAGLGTEIIATLFSVYGWFITPIGWFYAGVIWMYA
ncbi:MAG TPA: plasma-membrane proton-efflux P-type ATPase, partial [Ignavibacteria bacterium]|nr:plasma-membrane proton-efflux P-type ATPase [Ignavibacteria bacterium]